LTILKIRNILAKKETGNTEALKDLVVEAILEKKGQDVVSLDLREIHDTVSDYFIIAHGDSSTQVNAIFQSVMDSAKAAGQLPYHSEGMKNGEWVIVDFVDVVAHIFYREKRDFYMLEELWNDAKITKHNTAAAIKPKAVRQSNKKYGPVSEDTLADIERSLPANERAPVTTDFSGRPFLKRNAAKRALRTDEKRTAGTTHADATPKAKKYDGKKAADKKFVDKKIQERKAAGKKAAGPKAAPLKKAVAKKPTTKKTK
jgi:ribosome-associated protein